MINLFDKYALHVAWSNVEYDKKGECKLIGAYMYGPVLSIASKINPNDYINVDFYRQYSSIITKVYVGKLSWGDVEYTSDSNKVFLKKAILSHDSQLNRVPILKASDSLLIDTSKHEESIHPFNFLYETFVLNEFNELYNFNNKV